MEGAIQMSPLCEWRNRGIEPDNIPGFLKSLDNWVIWEGYDEQPDGKFKKRPVHPSGGYPINALDLTNHLSFKGALESHRNGVGDGLGIVLTGKPVETSDDGDLLFLVAVDLDAIKKRPEMAEGVSTKLKTYREFSPSGRGLRLMALSHDLIGKGNAGDGREMYCDKRFVTITGWGSKNPIRECTNELNILSNEWWPKKQKGGDMDSLHPQPEQRLNQMLAGEPLQENRGNIQRVKNLLARVPPDSPYDIWRDCIWSVASLGWDCGYQLAGDWSRKSAAHWPNEGEGCQAQVTLEGLFDNYDPERGITLGTLHHHAEENDPSLRMGVGIENQAAGLPKSYFPQAGMASRAPTPLSIDPLTEVQQRFFLFNLSGGIWMGDRDQINATPTGGSSVLQMYRMDAGRLLMARHLEILPVSADPKKVIFEFLRSPQTTVYNAVAFSPLPTPPETLNLWDGSPVEPIAGNSHTIKLFLQEVICDGDPTLFSYIIRFMAHMLQKPEEKPGVIISLLGGQGTGKGTFFTLLRAIWPSTTLTVSDINKVVSGFNAALERNYAVCMDEALFAGDKKAIDRLKSLVTEPVITIEQKYQPSREIESFHRFFLASNHSHVAQIDTDDRRFMFFRVSEKRKGDFEYWNKVHAAIKDPAVISAVVSALQRIDLIDFNVRLRPNTKAHIDQKIRSLSGFNRYWFEVLQSGEFKDDNQYLNLAWSEAFFISTHDMMWGWKAYERGQKQYAPRQERDFHSALKRLCPSASKDRHVASGNQKRGYQLPSLPDARADFTKAMGGEVQWDD